MAPILGYWDVRNLAEPTRLLLNFAGVEFEDKRYKVIPTKPYEMDTTEWQKDKANLGMPFPNLPYWIDGEVKLSESVAIIRYLARKHNLSAYSEEEQQLIDILEQRAKELSLTLFQTACRPDFDMRKEEYIRNLPDKLNPLECFLDGKRWFVGERVTYIEFLIYEALDHHRLLDSSCLRQFPNLRDFIDRVESLPNIKKYLQSSGYKKWPLFACITRWGYYQ